MTNCWHSHVHINNIFFLIKEITHYEQQYKRSDCTGWSIITVWVPSARWLLSQILSVFEFEKKKKVKNIENQNEVHRSACDFIVSIRIGRICRTSYHLGPCQWQGNWNGKYCCALNYLQSENIRILLPKGMWHPCTYQVAFSFGFSFNRWKVWYWNI